jgi:hypothetical protein
MAAVTGQAANSGAVPAGLRICRLLPYLTEVVDGGGCMGLQAALVGETHECDVCDDEAGLRAARAAGALRVTRSHIAPGLDQGRRTR